MEAMRRRRVFWLVGLALGFSVVALTLMGIALGFDHGWSRWLIVAGFIGLAAAMSASFAMRLVVLVSDSGVRAMWWDKASTARRVLWVIPMALRVVAVIAVLYIAVRNFDG